MYGISSAQTNMFSGIYLIISSFYSILCLHNPCSVTNLFLIDCPSLLLCVSLHTLLCGSIALIFFDLIPLLLQGFLALSSSSI
jgi:hypothetical protein